MPAFKDDTSIQPSSGSCIISSFDAPMPIGVLKFTDIGVATPGRRSNGSHTFRKGVGVGAAVGAAVGAEVGAAVGALVGYAVASH